MKPIIVATDFSAAARTAVNYAADMALALDAALIIVHVYQIPVAVTETATIIMPMEDLEEHAEKKLALLKKDLRHISPSRLQIETEARVGDVVEEVESVCQKHDPFVVVLGTTGLSALEESFFGSTTISIVKNIHSPVLVVPRGKEYGSGITAIGLAWDFTQPPVGFPLATVGSAVNTFRAALHVLHVETRDETESKPVDQQLMTSLHSLNPQYHHIQNQDTGEAINSYAEKNNLDLIMTIPRKHNFLESLFTKSHTKEFIRLAHMPVLCIHAE